MAPCNCGGTSAKKVDFVYTSGAGKQTSYRTHIEAQAAKVRDNHAGNIREVQR